MTESIAKFAGEKMSKPPYMDAAMAKAADICRADPIKAVRCLHTVLMQVLPVDADRRLRVVVDMLKQPDMYPKEKWEAVSTNSKKAAFETAYPAIKSERSSAGMSNSKAVSVAAGMVWSHKCWPPFWRNSDNVPVDTKAWVIQQAQVCVMHAAYARPDLDLAALLVDPWENSGTEPAFAT